jgi:hypothetical protein
MNRSGNVINMSVVMLVIIFFQLPVGAYFGFGTADIRWWICIGVLLGSLIAGAVYVVLLNAFLNFLRKILEKNEEFIWRYKWIGLFFYSFVTLSLIASAFLSFYFGFEFSRYMVSVSHHSMMEKTQPTKFGGRQSIEDIDAPAPCQIEGREKYTYTSINQLV